MATYNPELNYRVAPGRSIRLPRRIREQGQPREKGQLISEGRHIAPDAFTEKDMVHLVASGYAVAVEESPYARGREIPGRLQTIGAFKLDPDLLEGLSLEQLNVRIQEIDPKLSAAENKDEAIAILSQDFVKSLQPSFSEPRQIPLPSPKKDGENVEQKPAIFGNDE